MESVALRKAEAKAESKAKPKAQKKARAKAGSKATIPVALHVRGTCVTLVTLNALRLFPYSSFIPHNT